MRISLPPTSTHGAVPSVGTAIVPFPRPVPWIWLAPMLRLGIAGPARCASRPGVLALKSLSAGAPCARRETALGTRRAALGLLAGHQHQWTGVTQHGIAHPA